MGKVLYASVSVRHYLCLSLQLSLDRKFGWSRTRLGDTDHDLIYMNFGYGFISWSTNFYPGADPAPFSVNWGLDTDD